MMRPTVEERFWDKVEKTEGCWNWTAAKTAKGYGSFRVGAKTAHAHRFSYELHTGTKPDVNDQIDHTCHNKGCVNPQHLRAVSNKQNQENRSGPNRTTSSGVRGVHRLEWGKWRAYVGHNGKQIFLGCFETKEEAAEIVRETRTKLHTHSDMDRV